MGTKTFKPNPKYATKLRVVITLIALAVMAFGMLLGLVIALDPSPGAWIFCGGCRPWCWSSPTSAASATRSRTTR
jgi:hypothetical protein